MVSTPIDSQKVKDAIKKGGLKSETTSLFPKIPVENILSVIK